MSRVPVPAGLGKHYPLKLADPKRTIFVCAACLIRWPCLAAQAAVLARARQAEKEAE